MRHRQSSSPTTLTSSLPSSSTTITPDSNSAQTHPHTTMQLTFPGVAHLFVKMRRASNQAQVKTKAHHMESSSGSEPQTHPQLAGEGVTSVRKLPMTQVDVFTCVGGVNAIVLLRASRSTLMENAESVGANVLVDEIWKCTICKNRNGAYKVTIRYSASAARSEVPDPHKPVALENAKGVPGLMTILKRNE